MEERGPVWESIWWYCDKRANHPLSADPIHVVRCNEQAPSEGETKRNEDMKISYIRYIDIMFANTGLRFKEARRQFKRTLRDGNDC